MHVQWIEKVVVLVLYPLYKGKDRGRVSASCFQVSMEMIVMGEYVHGEGRHRKVFIEV
jgi:hypothetical protein